MIAVVKEFGKLQLAVLCLLVAASIAAAAQSFDEVCAQLSLRPYVTGDFAQEKAIKSSGKERILRSSGTFEFSLDGIAWNTKKPFASSLVVNMTSVTQTTSDGKKTVIDASTNQVFTSISGALMSLYSGDAAHLKESFFVAFSTDDSQSGGGPSRQEGTVQTPVRSAGGGILQKSWKAVLTPKDKTLSQVMKTLTLSGTFEGKNAVFDEILLTECSGETIKYMFSNMTYSKERAF